jgi:porin
VNVGDNLSALGGIFDGNQAGPGTGDAQQRDRYGINFRVNDPPLVLGQIQYSWNSKKGDPNLAGSFKLGGWRNFGPFSDLRFASNGVSLASPESSGTPAILSGDFGLWAVFEQQLYRVPKSDDRGIGLFGRVSSSPTDSSLLDCRRGDRVHRPERGKIERQVRRRGWLCARLTTRTGARR